MSQQLITSNEISPSTSISAGQITSVNANAITGLITSAQIANVAATQITGTVYVANTSITGSIRPTQLSTGAPSWDAFSNLSVGGNLNVSGSMRVTGTTTIENVNISNTTIVTSELVMAPAVNTQVINAGTSNTLSIITNGNTNIFDNNGNLGLGVTPSAWNSVWKAFQIGAAGSVHSTSSDNAMRFGYNLYYDGTVYRRITASAASYFIMNSDSSFSWLQAGSSTAGSQISWTTPMTLNASGNLGVGTSSPNAPLSISGTSRSSLLTFGVGTSAGTAGIAVADGLSGNTDGRLLFGNGGSSYAALRMVFNLTSGTQIDSVTWGSSASETNLNFQVNGGNVGIGTSSPATQLDVNGRVKTTNSVQTEYNVIMHSTMWCGGISNYITIPTGSTWTRLNIGSTNGGLPGFTNISVNTYMSTLDGNYVRLIFGVMGNSGYVNGQIEVYQVLYNLTQPSTSTAGNLSMRTTNLDGASDRGYQILVTQPFQFIGDSQYIYLRHNLSGSIFLFSVGIELLRI